MGEKNKKIRVMLSISPEDMALWKRMTRSSPKAKLVKKALRILFQLERGTVVLSTPEGGMIPKEIVFL